MRLRTGLAAATAAALLAGCGSSEKAAIVPKGCEKNSPSPQRAVPDGFPEPKNGLAAAEVAQRGEQLQVNGFAARSPGDATRDLLAAPGVKRIDSEDDGDDAEVSFTSGKYRYAFKFVAVCEGGSSFTALRVREPGR